MESRKGRNLFALLMVVVILAMFAAIIIPQIVRKKKEIVTEFEGYRVSILPSGTGSCHSCNRHLTMSDPNNSGGKEICLSACDWNLEDERFDAVNRRYVPKGHALEKYANFEKLEEIYRHVLSAQGPGLEKKPK